jgi:IclR family acetate operon transcriptional repressor
MDSYTSTSNERASSVRALDKAIRILENISSIEEDIDLATISRQMKIPKSTMLRLMNTLREHNLIHQDETTRRYRLGLGLIALGRAAERGFNLVQQIHPFLVDISNETGETASLMVLEGNYSVYIDQVVSTSLIRGQPRIGESLELHVSSGGKVLLSAMSDERITRILTGKILEPKTAKTITDIDVLLREIQKIREQGYAVDDEEAEIGGRCVAVPLWDKAGNVIAAVTVMGPTTRIRQRDFPELARIVKAGVLRASVSMGYHNRGERNER